MSKLTIDDLEREIAEAEQRRASALEAGWQKGVRQMDKRLKKLKKSVTSMSRNTAPMCHPSPSDLLGRLTRNRWS